MRTNKDFNRNIVVDCYAQHPEKYSRTFWIGFLMLGGYKLIILLILLIAWLILW